jgi:hypothetical protein
VILNKTILPTAKNSISTTILQLDTYNCPEIKGPAMIAATDIHKNQDGPPDKEADLPTEN